MPHLISLAAYGIKAWNKGDKSTEILSDIDGEGSDLLDFLHDVLTEIENETLDQKELQQAMSVTKLEKRSRILTGIIETGDYGRENNIINVNTKKTVYRRKKQDAEMWPFYFFIDIPEGAEDGLLILQRTGHFGIKNLLHWVLETALTEKFPDLKLRFSHLVDQDEMAEIVRGRVQKISFVRMSIPSDVADSYDRGHAEVKGSVELVIRARKGSALPMNSWLSAILRGRRHSGVFALDDNEQFSYENVKAEVKFGHSSRTIDVGDPGRLRQYHDVTDAVTMGRDGYPNYDSIDDQAHGLAAKLRTVLYG